MYTIPKKIMGFFFALCMVGSSFNVRILADGTKDYTDFGKISIKDGNGQLISGDTEAKTSDQFTMEINDIDFDDDENTMTISMPSELKLMDGAQLQNENGGSDGTASVAGNTVTVTKPDTKEKESPADDEEDFDDEDQSDSEDTEEDEDEDVRENEELNEGMPDDSEDPGEDDESVGVDPVRYKSDEIEEDEDDSNYTLFVSFYVKADVDLSGHTFHYKQETVTVKGQIKWKNDSESDRPKQVSLKLENDKDAKTKTAKVRGSGWKFAFANLPKYDADITPIAYSLDEDAISVDGYTENIDRNENAYTITMTKKESGDKSSKDKTRTTYNITTSSDDNGTIDSSKTVESGEDVTIKYKAKEGYEVDSVKVNGNAIDDKSGSYTFKKVTEDQTIEVTFREIPTKKVRTSTLSKDSIVYKARFSKNYHLKKDCTAFNVAKTEIRSLTLEEALRQGLKPCQKEFIDDGYSFKVPVVRKRYRRVTTTVSGTKTWDDNNNANKKRPDSIIVYLYYGRGADDRVAYIITGSDRDNTWTYTFTGLPKYNADGKEIQYAIREQALTYYDGTVKGYDLTNTYNGRSKKGTIRVDTGEETGAGMYIGLLVVAAAAIVVIVVWRKKSSK